MLTPQTLQKLPDDLVDLVSEVQTDIIKSIAKKLVKADYGRDQFLQCGRTGGRGA